ncbi:MAG: FixH family protein [Candidatus Obscuribacterales bacterium]|nr:FixH family protein [Candidatus Obscuribacterales bacterium]
MKTPTEELKKILEGNDEVSIAQDVQKFFQRHGDNLPLPGEDTAFDRAMWNASQFVELSPTDEGILSRVTLRLLSEAADPVASAVLKLRDLVGAGRDAAVGTWQDMLATMSWQQMVPAGALRGVGSRMVSLGTFQQDLDGANLQVNLGWMVDQDQFRILLNAKDEKGAAIPDVELRVKEKDGDVIFTRKTNQDGTVVAPNVKVGPGYYQIEILVGDKVAQTPYFVL